jgi:LysM repeat protein
MVAVAVLGALAVIGACGELQPVEYTRATTTTVDDPLEDMPDPTAAGPTTTRPDLRVARYTVEPGDTVNGIAARFGVSAAALMDLNGLERAADLTAGETIRIPAPTDTVPPPWLQEERREWE